MMTISKRELGYYENLLRMYSATAQRICNIRWDFILSYTKAKSVLDYGSGVGWFRAFRPEGVEVDTYDKASYPQTGISSSRYDVVCFWDVLEHIANFKEIEPVLNSTKFVALTIPIKPPKVNLKNWKHYKPGEHLHYFTLEMLDDFFETYGFERIEEGKLECPPRVDIWSCLYKKVNGA